jgi:ribosomal 30S subunit maturation factor RimM
MPEVEMTEEGYYKSIYGDLIEIISDNKKNFYIPMNKDNLVKIDSEKKIIIVNPLKGILD